MVAREDRGSFGGPCRVLRHLMVSAFRQVLEQRVGPKGAGVALLAVAISTLALVPFALVRFPPINDYPFHLARIMMTCRLRDFAHFYAIGTFLLPNVAMDAIAVPIGWVTGAEAAVRLFVEATLVLLILGTLSLNAAVHRLQSWPLLGAALAYNGISRFGFFNYLFGLALALFAIALWFRMRDGGAKLVAAFACCIVLIFCHMEAFAIYAVVAGGIELERSISAWRKERSWAPLRQLLYAASPFVLTIALFLLASPTVSAENYYTYAGGWGTKPVGAFFSLSSGYLWLDAITLLSIFALAIWLALRGWLSYSRPLAVGIALLVLALIVLPPELLGSIYADSRLGPAIVLLALASFGVATTAPRYVLFVVGALALFLTAMHTIVLSTTWIGFDREIRPIVQAFDVLPTGTTLFAITAEPFPRLVADSAERQRAWRPPLKHVASYAILHGPLFVPMNYADPTKQPLIVAKAFADVKNYQGDKPLRVANGQALTKVLSYIHTRTASSWKKLGTPYVFVMGRKTLGPLKLPSWAVPVTEGDRFLILRLEVAQRR